MLPKVGEGDSLGLCTVIFHENFYATDTIVVNQGGTSSGKTWSIMQVLIWRALTEPGVIITVAGRSVPDLKAGAYRDTEKIYRGSPYMQQRVKDVNISDRRYTFDNGSVIEFRSYEDTYSARGGKRDYLFMNEANAFPFDTFWELSRRTFKQVYLDYNPTIRFWVHEKLIGTAGVKLIISDHRHNTFLSEAQHRLIEEEPDPDRWRVYARGLTGNVHGLIYNNWEEILVKDFPHKEENFFAGLDFGWTNDPTALIKVVRIGREVFLDELIYETGVPMRMVKEVMHLNKFTHRHPVYADHDKYAISELRRLRAGNIHMAKKSILPGIAKVKEYKIYYTARSTNLKEEVGKYMWDKDRATGEFVNMPIDSFNHAMDAVRYAIYSHFWVNKN